MYTEKRILVLGNGPSLKKEYFNSLYGIDTLGMNVAYRYWKRINWYPTIYTCLDDQVVLSHADEINCLITENRCEHFFLHQNILKEYPSLANKRNVTFLTQMLFGEKHKSTSESFGLSHRPTEPFRTKHGSKLTTGSYSVRFASHLGYRQIGLVGIDCRYKEDIPEAEALEGYALRIQKTPGKNSNYFFDDYQQEGDVYNVPNPSVHKGNLHLQSFEAINDDFRSFDIPTKLKVCTTESELYSQSVFEYAPVESFLSKKRLSALFMPFVRSEVQIILDRFRTWGSADGFAPYSTVPESPSVSLNLAFNKRQDLSLEREVRAVYETESLDRYFSGLSFHYCDLEGDRDLYSKGGDRPHGPDGYMAGPNNQFFEILGKFSRGMSHIALMESDVAPIRPGWMEKLEEIVAQSEDFWICGSHYRGNAAIQALWHINGNAIYNVGDPDFRDFIENEFKNALYERIEKFPRTAYDTVLHYIFRDMFSGKASADVRELWSQCAHKIRFSEFIVDLSHDYDREPEKLLDLNEARKLFPNSFLIHGAVAAIAQEIMQKPASNENARLVGEKPPHSQYADILIIDPDAVDWFGHYMAYNDKLSAALEHLGASVEVLCNVNLAKEILESRPDFRPIFTIESRFIGKKLFNAKEIEEFEKQITEYLENRNTDRETRIYMYCGSFEHAEIFSRVINSFPKLSAHINLFYEAFEECRTAEWEKRWKNNVANLRRDRLRITVPTERLQQYFLELVGVKYDVAPHPSTAFSDSEFRSNSGALAAPLTTTLPCNYQVLFPSSSRRGKGFEANLAVAKAVSLLPNTEVVLRYSKPEEAAKHRPAIEQLRESATIIEGELDNESYSQLFASAQISILLYDQGAFACRTSGLLLDALYNGLPVVAMRGSWLGDMVEKYSCGVAIKDNVADEVVEAVKEIESNYEVYKINTIKGAKNYFSGNSWSILASSILDWPPNEQVTPSSATDAETLPKRMLIIGNGPSVATLIEAGLDKIPDDVDTFGMGAAYRFFREANWWPTYYALADSKVVHSHRDALKAIIEDERVGTKRFYFSRPLSEHPRFEQIPHSSTGDFCFRKSMELGYKEIYLIGIEGSYVEEIAESRPLTDEEFTALGYDELNLAPALRKLRIITKTPKKNPNYFFDSYQQEGDVYSLPQSKAHVSGWERSFSAKETACSVYNLSDISKIDFIPRLSLADFLAGRKRPERIFEHLRSDAASVDETAVVAELLQSCKGRKHVMVDVGAHHGSSAACFDKLDWSIHCFEPDPANRAKLVERFGKAENVKIDERAVSDRPQKNVAFFKSDESTGISGLHAFRDTHRQEGRVDLTTVAEIIEDRDLHQVDFLKIDVEGFDFNVLKGVPWDRIQPDGKLFRPDVIECEYEDAKTAKMGHTWRDIAAYLHERNYAVYISEWHPIVRYGIAHDWKRVVPYPGIDVPTESWGNILAFREDPGFDKVAAAFEKLVTKNPAKPAASPGKTKGPKKAKAAAKASSVEHASPAIGKSIPVIAPPLPTRSGKWAKLKRDPRAFFRDSDVQALRPLHHLFRPPSLSKREAEAEEQEKLCNGGRFPFLPVSRKALAKAQVAAQETELSLKRELNRLRKEARKMEAAQSTELAQTRLKFRKKLKNSEVRSENKLTKRTKATRASLQAEVQASAEALRRDVETEAQNTRSENLAIGQRLDTIEEMIQAFQAAVEKDSVALNEKIGADLEALEAKLEILVREQATERLDKFKVRLASLSDEIAIREKSLQDEMSENSQAIAALEKGMVETSAALEKRIGALQVELSDVSEREREQSEAHARYKEKSEQKIQFADRGQAAARNDLTDLQEKFEALSVEKDEQENLLGVIADELEKLLETSGQKSSTASDAKKSAAKNKKGG